MAERSNLWTTSSTPLAGSHQLTGISQDTWRTIWKSLLGDCVIRLDRGSLSVNAASGAVTVGTGSGCVSGFIYENDAAKSISIPTPTSATRIDRIVLRANWTDMKVTAERIAGAEGGSAPALTTSEGTTWDVLLADVSITTGGAITVTDKRTFGRLDGVPLVASNQHGNRNPTRVYVQDADPGSVANGSVWVKSA